MSKFDVTKDSIDNIISKYEIFIPDFQRKLVWSADKKQQLIDSLNREFPIGAFTLYFNNAKNEYLLVDGLQRYNTIKTFLKNPESIFPFNVFYKMIEDDVFSFSSSNSIGIKELKKSIKSWYSKLKTDDTSQNYRFENMKLLSESFNENGLVSISTDFELFQRIREILLKKIDFRNQIIALIIYKGDEADLSDIFTKINQKNVSLTSYEILHSLWYNFDMPDEYNGFNYKLFFEEKIRENPDYDNNVRVEKFNVYMFISALQYQISEQKFKYDRNPESKKSLDDIISSDIIFDAISTAKCSKSNAINKVIKGLCEDKLVSEYSDYLFKLGIATRDTLKMLNMFIYENHINIINSKYFYLYLFYILINYNYEIMNDSIIQNDFNPNCDILSKDYIQKISSQRWFVDENRQVSFFDERINELKLLIKNNKLDKDNLEKLIENFMIEKEKNLEEI